MRHVDCISQLRTRLDSTNTCSLLNLISFNYITIKRRQFLLLTRSNLAILYNASKYRAFKLKQRLMKSYPQLVFCVPKMRNVSEIVYVENLDSSELVEEHMSIKSENNNEDFDGESCTIDDDDLNSNTETEGNSKVNELQILYNAALILCQKVQEIPKLNLPWPPLASNLTMDNISNPTMRTRLDFKSTQFDHVRGEAEDWIKMRGLEI